MRENLDASLKLMFGAEGGYSNRSTDAGGPTKFGVTAKTLGAHRGVGSVSADQVKNLTLQEARDIYVTSYWAQSGGDQLPSGLDYEAFDFGVNSGPPTAVKHLQKVLGVAADGWIGPETLARVSYYHGGIEQLIKDYADERMAYLRSLKGPQGFTANGRGWTIRVTGIDPNGQWKPTPGVVGNALALAKADGGRPAELVTAPAPLPANGDSKAPPPEPNPWTKPDVLLPAGGAVVTGAGTVLTSGMDPIRLALAIGIIVIIGLGAYYAFRRISRTPA